LHLVCIFGDVAALDVLLSSTYRKNDRDVFANFFDRNSKDSRELSPLHYACIYENLECITGLLANGARIDVAYKQMQPVHMAALLGKTDVLRVLLERGADRDAPDYNTNATPIFYAAYGGSIACIDLLAAKGAFIDAEDRSGLTALLIGGVSGNVPVITYLLHSERPGHQRAVMSSLDGTVSLPWTVLTANHPDLRALLSRFGKDRLALDYPPFKRTLLHRAVLMLDDEALMEAVVSLINRSDARILDAVDSFGRTALHYAAALGKKMAMMRILEAGADPSAKDKAGNTVREALVSNSSHVHTFVLRLCTCAVLPTAPRCC
jgi:ankyrin repeat protein